jgi:hypothetical protein
MEYEVKESFFEGCRNKVVVDRGCGRWRLRLMEEENGFVRAEENFNLRLARKSKGEFA